MRAFAKCFNWFRIPPIIQAIAALARMVTLFCAGMSGHPGARRVDFCCLRYQTDPKVQGHDPQNRTQRPLPLRQRQEVQAVLWQVRGTRGTCG
jgi:hypothetical protein